MKANKILFIAILFSLCLAASVTFADSEPYTLSVPFTGQPTTVSGPAQYLQNFFLFATSAVALLAMARIIYAAIKLLASSGNTSAIGDAKDIIAQSLWGIALLAGAYLILYTINPDLVRLGALQQKITNRVRPLNVAEIKNASLQFDLKLDDAVRQLQSEEASRAAQSAQTQGDIDKVRQQLTALRNTLAGTTDPTVRNNLEIDIKQTEIDLQKKQISITSNEAAIVKADLDRFQIEQIQNALKTLRPQTVTYGVSVGGSYGTYTTSTNNDVVSAVSALENCTNPPSGCNIEITDGKIRVFINGSPLELRDISTTEEMTALQNQINNLGQDAGKRLNELKQQNQQLQNLETELNTLLGA